MRAGAFCLMIAALTCTAFAAVADEARALAARNRAFCTQHRNDDNGTRAMCADRPWCDTHWNDDRVSRIACDLFRTKADLRLAAPSVTLASLRNSRNLSESEKRSQCLGSCLSVIVQGDKPPKAEPDLLPDGMVDAKLAMRADLYFGTLPKLVVKIGIGSEGGGIISVNTARQGGPRHTLTAHLTEAEADHILAALGKSRFWQLPKEPRHQGAADGELASIEVSIPGRQHHVFDFVGPSPDAVDLSVLARSITTIVFARWKGI